MMAVYVDRVHSVRMEVTRKGPWRYPTVCHMMADTDLELEAMAKRLRLRKDWRHGDHYDLTENKRRAVVAKGAIEVTEYEMVKMRQRKRQAVEAAGDE